MTKREKRLLEILKESRQRGAASVLVNKGLAEQYGYGYRITQKGMGAR